MAEALAADPACDNPTEGAYRASIVCRNRFYEGEELEILSPGQPVRTCKVEQLVWHVAPNSDVADVEKRDEGFQIGADITDADAKLAKVSVANRAMDRYSFQVPFPLKERDILRIVRGGQDLGRQL